ncbi:MAG: hypothetical protein JXB17_07990 [Bacteroidales bacterium]|nr:hypothetical protein [Bacteroidales bacterium]
MIYIQFTLSAIVLLIIAFQDFKFRAVSWFLFPLLFVFYIFRGLYYIDMFEFIINFGINILFIILQLGVVFSYFAIKKGKIFETFKKAIGLGDILFFVIICLNFSLINLILYQIFSLLLILLYFGILRMTKILKKKLIPLAGSMSVTLLVSTGLHDILKVIDLYDYSWINIFF